MEIVRKVDELGKPAWIALMVLGFCIFWPVGLALLTYLIVSGKMHAWKYAGCGNWESHWDRKMARHRERWERRHGSGNRAFDEYRAETLRRLEEEQKEFRDFLDRLRFAKDKEEFDAFLRDRRDRAGDRPEPKPDV